MRHEKGASVKAEFAYEVGRSGKRLRVAEEIDGATVTIDYTYDRLGRLTAADRSSGADASYTYDIVGNRLSKTLGGNTTTYTYNALDQLTGEDGTYAYTYTYDGNGNLTKKEWGSEEINYIYDSRNRLRKMYDGEASGLPDLEYGYDHAGNRFAKAERTGSNDFTRLTFLIDNNNLTGYSQTLLEINHNTGAIDKRYEYGDDLYCQVDSPTAASPIERFFLYDGLGSTRSLTDSGGAIQQGQSYNYHPFGDLLNYQGTPNTNHLFTGEYFDSDLDYYYLRARYYMPELGRFGGLDPTLDSINKFHKYTYAAADPVNYADYSGKFVPAEVLLITSLADRVKSISDEITLIPSPRLYQREHLVPIQEYHFNNAYQVFKETIDFLRNNGDQGLAGRLESLATERRIRVDIGTTLAFRNAWGQKYRPSRQEPPSILLATQNFSLYSLWYFYLSDLRGNTQPHCEEIDIEFFRIVQLAAILRHEEHHLRFAQGVDSSEEHKLIYPADVIFWHRKLDTNRSIK